MTETNSIQSNNEKLKQLLLYSEFNLYDILMVN